MSIGGDVEEVFGNESSGHVKEFEYTPTYASYQRIFHGTKRLTDLHPHIDKQRRSGSPFFAATIDVFIEDIDHGRDSNIDGIFKI